MADARTESHRPQSSITLCFIWMAVAATILGACDQPRPLATAQPSAPPAPKTRAASIPTGAVKMQPSDDAWPPTAAPGWEPPAPLGEPIDTPGAEDSPFLTLDGQELYFFFTPDLNIPVERQIGDGATGIWVSQRASDTDWSEPTRVVLSDPGQVALDGCEFVLGEVMYFCSVRLGNLREVDLYTARRVNGTWLDWQNAGRQLNLDYAVGEMHISADGQTLYFGSSRPGGLGGRDLWSSTRTAEGWSIPVDLGGPVNSAGDEDRPYLSPDGQELWFDGTSRQDRPGPAVFRSLRQVDGSWGPPEEIVSTFAGEPTLSADGRTLYSVQHFFSPDMTRMIEADIYVTKRK